MTQSLTPCVAPTSAHSCELLCIHIKEQLRARRWRGSQRAGLEPAGEESRVRGAGLAPSPRPPEPRSPRRPGCLLTRLPSGLNGPLPSLCSGTPPNRHAHTLWESTASPPRRPPITRVRTPSPTEGSVPGPNTSGLKQSESLVQPFHSD